MNAKEYMIENNVAVMIDNDWQERTFKSLMRASGERAKRYCVDKDVTPIYWFFLETSSDPVSGVKSHILCMSDHIRHTKKSNLYAVSEACDNIISVHELKRAIK